MTSPAGGPDRDPVAEHLRRTMAGAAARRRPGPAPVEHILRAGHARRVRRRRVTVAAAACLVVGLAFPVARFAAARDARTVEPPAVTASPSPSVSVSRPPEDKPLSVHVGSGTVAGLPWSVSFQYYATPPPGYQPAPNAPTHSPILCERMYIGGVLLDQAGGAWPDCDYTQGQDPAGVGEAGSFPAGGPQQNGYFVFIGRPVPGTTYTVVTLNDGKHLTARAVTLPGIGTKRYAFAYGPGEAIGTRTDYDASGTVLNTQDGSNP